MIKIRHGHPILYASNVLSILNSGHKRIESHTALVFQWSGVNQRDSVVVRVPASQSVDLGVHSLCRVIPTDFKKMVSTAYLLGAQHLWEIVESKPASSLVVSLGKALNGTAHFYVEDRCPRHLEKSNSQASADILSKNIAIQFTFS